MAVIQLLWKIFDGVTRRIGHGRLLMFLVAASLALQIAGNSESSRSRGASVPSSKRISRNPLSPAATGSGSGPG
jgi:hypothetical protein